VGLEQSRDTTRSRFGERALRTFDARRAQASPDALEGRRVVDLPAEARHVVGRTSGHHEPLLPVVTAQRQSIHRARGHLKPEDVGGKRLPSVQVAHLECQVAKPYTVAHRAPSQRKKSVVFIPSSTPPKFRAGFSGLLA
jgi:hypothetical protein